MLTRLRARAIDGATMLARYLDARRERDELRAELREVTRKRNDERMELRRSRVKAERYHSISDGLHAEWDAALAERDELRAEVERLTVENDELRAAGDRLVAETVSFATERGELLRLRREVERLTAERDEHVQGVSVLACRIDRIQQERDARIPTDIDGAQAWCEARGVRVERGDGDYEERWQVVIDGAVVHLASEPDDAVSEAVMWTLFRMWRDGA